MEAKTHIALVSIHAFSHQVSILEFAKRLIHLHPNFQVTCIIPTLSSSSTPSKSFFESLPPSIECIFLPPVDFDDLKNEVSVEVQLQLAVSRSMPSARKVLGSLMSSSSKPVALIVDAIAHEALEFAKELNFLSYIYFACSAMVLSMCLYWSKIDEKISCEYRDHPEPIEIPGCISIHGIDLPNSVQNRLSQAYKFFVNRCERFRLANGIILNSFVELEAEALRASQDQCNGNNPLVYPIGPLTQSVLNSYGKQWECLTWLDDQPLKSVLYVSFGSGGTLSQNQIKELALGLELSGHKFLWVNFRAPNDKASATYLSENKVDPLNFLPLGFLERTKGQGLVMSSWAPQIEVLSHNSIGAFLTHCGWNSILESIVKGVPMVAWPLFAEQRTNTVLVTDGLKIAVRPKVNSNGMVAKEDVVDAIRCLLEGLESQQFHKRIEELKDSAAHALMEDGSSTKTLSQLALKWKSLGDSILEK